MKNLRHTLLVLVAVTSASVTFAGPGPQFWQQRGANNTTVKTAAASVEKSPAAATAKQGTPTGTAPGSGMDAETAKCKAKCCS